jgi:hypothetical protein
VALVVAALGGVGSTCGGGDGSGGSRAVVKVQTPDARCVAMSTAAFPPAFDFVPDAPGRVLAFDFSPPTLVPIDVEPVPPEISLVPASTALPADSDGDGLEEGASPPFGVPLVPIPDGVFAVDSDLAFVTTSSYEAVLFFDPSRGELREFNVVVPDPPFAPGDNVLLPPPGTSRVQTGISTAACVRPPPGALDSRGESMDVALADVPRCDPDLPSFSPNFTSGAALVDWGSGGLLFVSMSNLNEGKGTLDTQYLPGAVLVYGVRFTVDPPEISPYAPAPVLETSGFNPTHVTAVRIGGRDFLLVNVSGAIGLVTDDPTTRDVIERGAVALSEASIDVIDARSLRLVARYPLGPAGLSSEGPAIDASKRVAVMGSQLDRVLYAVDLAPLASLPRGGGSGVIELTDAVIFDADHPFRIPSIAGGAPADVCPGFTGGVAFNDAGDRIFASDFCDGSLAGVAVDLGGDPTTAELRDRFALTGPDVFVLVGEPEGMLCGIRVESP